MYVIVYIIRMEIGNTMICNISEIFSYHLDKAEDRTEQRKEQ